MTHFYDEEFSDIKNYLTEISNTTETMITGVFGLLAKDNTVSPAEIIDKDNEVDRLDLLINGKCVRLLTLYAPKSTELRFVTESLHIIIDFERIGDHCKKIARRLMNITLGDTAFMAGELLKIKEYIQALPSRALKAFLEADIVVAEEISSNDDIVNDLCIAIDNKIIELMRETPDRIEELFHLASTIKRLERIADHAVNIAGSSFFFTEGHFRRHRDKIT